eukprot:Phypoly_transcript_03369.p1 GENE.Phypoly_transcript_03369~~Phypoly_transcript_03369.p1  ORF type:complete len:355 (-),score=67.16 Phypoly_transcript_03369:101-1165(-)
MVVQEGEFTSVPVIDIRALVDSSHSPQDKVDVAKQIYDACRRVGFFYVTHHGVSEELQQKLMELSRQFFALPVEEKLEINMEKGGKAWRGFFKVGDELTSGKPDGKEGIYLGQEITDLSHPKIKEGAPLHGQNLFPKRPAALRQVILDYFDEMTKLGHTLMRGIALSLGLEENYFQKNFTNDPLCLFRIFNYPHSFKGVDGKIYESEELWGVGEHTDYGVLTILKQDSLGGLQVKNRDPKWIPAPPIENSFVINIGDMLEKMTKGLYRSTPHRVRNTAGVDRLSFPFFFDPNFDAKMGPLPLTPEQEELAKGDVNYARWDNASVHDFDGTYGEYLLNKVSKVFPQLAVTNLKKN